MRKLVCEALENRTLLASDWQNPGQVLDVNHDLSVSPLDALIGINRLNSRADRTFPPRSPGTNEPYYDVDGNGAHNPLDILLVINALNSRKPTVNIELLKDSGVGPGANTDRITSDLSIRGAISFAASSQLWGRLDADTTWHDFTNFVTASQAFSIPQNELIKAFGNMPNDGSHTLRFQARSGSKSDQAGAEVDLPFVLDTSSQELNIAKQFDSPTTVIVALPGVIQVPLGERASPTTLLASKIKLYDATFDKLQTGSVEITPRGVSISSDGRTLLVDPPDNNNSTKYLVAVGEGAVEDEAGNRNSAFDTFANLYSQNTSSPIVWNKLSFATAFQRRVVEYTFGLDHPDLFILNGLRASSLSQIELFAPSGKSVLSWSFGIGGGSANGANSSKMLTEVGEYRLRIALPEVSEVAFNPTLASLLPNLPSDLTVSGDWRQTHAYSLTVTDTDRIYFKNNLAGEALFDVSLLDSYGKSVRAKKLNSDTVFDVTSPGRYVVLIEPRPLAFTNFDFSIYLRKSTAFQLTLGQLTEHVFDAPGQQATYYFSISPAKYYSLVYESPDVAVKLFDPSTSSLLSSSLARDTVGFYSYKSGQGFVQLTFDRSNIATASTKFYLTESDMTYEVPTPETIHVEPLQDGVTRRDFHLPNESYEFTFDANANELFAFRDGLNLAAHSQRFTLLAPNGTAILPLESIYDAVVYRTPYAGQYRLRAKGETFQWQTLAKAPSLQSSSNVHGEFADSWFSVFQFKATEPRFYAHAINAADAIEWRLVDSHGETVGRANFNADMDLAVKVGENYTLIVAKLFASKDIKFDFRRIVPVTTSRAATLGVAVSGVLAERGDRQIIELDLTAGQLIQLTSNLDPLKARVRWLDLQLHEFPGFQDIDPARPDRIVNSRVHRVQIENLRSEPLNYSLQFDSVQPSFDVPTQLVGFGVIHSGSVGDIPANFEFKVTAGAVYIFDWLLPESSVISIELKDADGNLVTSLGYGHDSFQVAQTSGVTKLQVRSLGVSSVPYSFRMVSPSLAAPATLGVEKSASVIPFGLEMFRIPLVAPTELFLEGPGNGYGTSTHLYRNATTADPTDWAYLPLEPLGQFFDGEGLVWLKNDSSETYNSKFTVRDVANFPLLPLNTITTFPSEYNRSYVFPFQTLAPVSVATSTHYSIVDPGGNLVARDSDLGNTVYKLKMPGLYRAIVTGANDIETGNSNSTTFELHTQVIAEKTAAISETITSEITHIGDIHRYRFKLNAGTPLVLGMEFSEGRFSRWIAPDGEIVSLFEQKDWSVLPVYMTGEYQLEVYANASQVAYKFQLTDLSQLVPITPGQHTGATVPGIPTIVRISGSPHQLLGIQYSSIARPTVVDRLGQPLNTVNHFHVSKNILPSDGSAFLVITNQEIDEPLDYSFEVNLIETQPSVTKIGQPILGTLPVKWSGKSYSFHVDEPTWLRVVAQGSGNLEVGLKLPNGDSRDISREIFTLVLPGDYQVHIYNQSRDANNFSLTIDLLDRAPMVPLDEWVSINTGGNYRIEIPESGRYELQLRDRNNTPVATSDIRVLTTFGQEIPFQEISRATLEKDSHWLTFRNKSAGDTSEYSLRIVPIKTTLSALTAGQSSEFKLDPSGTQEYLVRMPLTLGARYLIDQFRIDGDVSVVMRRESDPFENWVPADRSLIPSSDGTDALLFRISGTGILRLRIVDLNAAPQLTLNTAASVNLSATVRAQAWRIDGALGDRIEFINDSSPDKSISWMIVDEGMNVIAKNGDRPLSLSIVNRQRFVLVVIANFPLDSALTLPFRTVVTSNF